MTPRRYWIVLRPNDSRGHYVAEEGTDLEFELEQGYEVVEVVEVRASKLVLEVREP